MSSDGASDIQEADRRDVAKAQSGRGSGSEKDVEKMGLAREAAVVRNLDLIEDKDPYGDGVEDKDHINFRTMPWWKAAALLLAETASLGILSMPSVFHRLGMFGGVFTVFMLGLMSTYTGFILAQYKIRHPSVANFSDAGAIMFGKWGRELIGAMLIIKVVFVQGSHILSTTIALENISSNAICKIIWAVIVMVISFLLETPRTFSKASYVSVASVTAILTAVLITIIASGVQDHPSSMPTNAAPVEWNAFENHGFKSVFSGITDIIFAFGGHVAIFSFVAEMRDPAEFPKALYLTQGVATIIYIVTGATIYSFGGQYVTSPALTMTSKAVKITTYSIALFSTIGAGVVVSYVGGKYIWLRLFRGTPFLTSKSYRAWGAWLIIIATTWIIAFIIAEVIPFFNELLSIISSLFTVWFTYGLSSILWMGETSDPPFQSKRFAIREEDEKTLVAEGQGASMWRARPMPRARGLFTSPGQTAMTLLNVFIVVFSAAVMGIGTYSAVSNIVDNYRSGEYPSPFSC